MKTTIQLNKKTALRLEELKRSYGNSYDDVVTALLDQMPEDEFLPGEIEEVQKGLEDIKAGRVYTSEQIKKKLGLK